MFFISYSLFFLIFIKDANNSGCYVIYFKVFVIIFFFTGYDMAPVSSKPRVRPLVISIIILGFGILCFSYLRMSTTWLPSQVNLKEEGQTNQAEIPVSKKEQDQTIGSKKDQAEFPVSNKEQNQTIILIWTWPYTPHFVPTCCCSDLLNIEGCHITTDINMYNKSDAVIFQHRNIHDDLSNMPKSQRPPFQKWVWMDFESPTHSVKKPSCKSLFNLTMNYRQDADIGVPYGAIVQTEDNNFTIPNKTKLVCWIVSNWRLHYKRVKYYDELKQHMNVQVYGSAFKKAVSSQDFYPLISSCKFYLSFENSIHKDYITEKLYNPMYVGTVPIVLGPSRQNYENFVPGDSFIHIDDFPSPQKLAEYILLLDKNEEMYQRYFNFHKHFKVHFNVFFNRLCHACSYVKAHKKEYKVVNDLISWYWGW